MNHGTLHTLSKQDLVSLIEAQAAQIEAQTAQITSLMARIAELEARLSAPPKTPDNSSTPPSKGQKANLPDRVKSRRGGRAGVSRALSEHPDRIIEATLSACPHCACVLGSADQPDTHAYDHIELPAISPTVTRINRHRGVCPCCRRQVTAPAPKGFEPGSPFGPGLCALIIHLHVTQAISFERLVRVLAEVFGLTISEGAIANILSRAGAPLLAAAAPIADAVRASPVVGSDETSARVGGKNWWQWVLLGSTAIYHVIADTRAASVVTAFMNGARPEVWVADRYGGQLGHVDLTRRGASAKTALYFSWDAASWHMSKALNRHVEFLNGWAAYDSAPRVVLVPLPARAQFLNVIESVFSGMARAVIHNSNFKDENEAKKVIDGYIEQRNAYFLRHPKRAGNKIWGCEKLPSAFNETRNFKDPAYR